MQLQTPKGSQLNVGDNTVRLPKPTQGQFHSFVQFLDEEGLSLLSIYSVRQWNQKWISTCVDVSAIVAHGYPRSRLIHQRR
jgi:hypothetical protein